MFSPESLWYESDISVFLCPRTLFSVDLKFQIIESKESSVIFFRFSFSLALASEVLAHTSNNLSGFSHLNKSVNCPVNVLDRVSSWQLDADSSLVFGHNWVAEANNKYSTPCKGLENSVCANQDSINERLKRDGLLSPIDKVQKNVIQHWHFAGPIFQAK